MTLSEITASNVMPEVYPLPQDNENQDSKSLDLIPGCRQCITIFTRKSTHRVPGHKHPMLWKAVLASYALLFNCLGDQCHIYYLLFALQYTTAHLWVPFFLQILGGIRGR